MSSTQNHSSSSMPNGFDPHLAAAILQTEIGTQDGAEAAPERQTDDDLKGSDGAPTTAEPEALAKPKRGSRAVRQAPASAESSPSITPRGPAFREGLLIDGPERNSALIRHPLTTDDMQIATPAVRMVYRVVHRAITKRLPGTNFAGAPRIGKGTCRKLFAKMLAHDFPNVPVGQLVALAHDRSTESKLWTDIAEALGLAVISSRDIGRLRNKVLSAILTACAAMESNIYVLFVDEAQNWREMELSLLKDLSNLLDTKGIRMVYIGFGHEDLHDVRAALLRKERFDLVGRFLTKIYPMYGILNLDHLTAVLEQMDNPRFDYPAQSGICYAEFFMPRAYAAGWRISSEAVRLWGAFDRASRHAIQRPAANVGMASFVFAVKQFLESAYSEDFAGFAGTPDLWHAAVDDSDYAGGLR